MPNVLFCLTFWLFFASKIAQDWVMEFRLGHQYSIGRIIYKARRQLNIFSLCWFLPQTQNYFEFIFVLSTKEWGIEKSIMKAPKNVNVLQKNNKNINVFCYCLYCYFKKVFTNCIHNIIIFNEHVLYMYKLEVL